MVENRRIVAAIDATRPVYRGRGVEPQNVQVARHLASSNDGQKHCSAIEGSQQWAVLKTAQPSASQLAGCYGKAAYPSKGAAIDAFQRVQKRKHRGFQCRAYKCPHCHAWHFGTLNGGL